MKRTVLLLALAAVAAASSPALAAETVRSITLATGSAHERPATVSDMQRKFTATGPLCKDPNTGLFVFCNKVSPANATPTNEGPSGLLQPIKDAVLADLNSAFNLAVQQDQQSVTAAGYAASQTALTSTPNRNGPRTARASTSRATVATVRKSTAWARMAARPGA